MGEGFVSVSIRIYRNHHLPRAGRHQVAIAAGALPVLARRQGPCAGSPACAWSRYRAAWPLLLPAVFQNRNRAKSTACSWSRFASRARRALREGKLRQPARPAAFHAPPGRRAPDLVARSL